jgi:hypothetical protein
MKNALIFCFTMLFMFSCAKDEGIDETAVMTENTYGFNSMTFEELNTLMLDYGLEPLNYERILDVAQRARVYRRQKGKIEKSGTCSYADTFGEWTTFQNTGACNYTLSYTISGGDLAAAQGYRNVYGTNAPSGNSWNGYSACVSENFGTISYFNLGTGEYTVDQDDIDIVTAYILGLC